MKLLRKCMCFFALCGVLSAISGCKNEKTDIKTAANNNMELVDTKALGEKENEFYFIDDNAEIVKYSGYRYMDNFEDGVSLVEIYGPSQEGVYQLIDTKENVLAQGVKIEKKNIVDQTFYFIKDVNDKKGIINSKGEIVAEYKYIDIYELDDGQSNWEDIIFCKMEDTSADIFDKNGKHLCNIPAGYVTSEYGYKGVSFSNKKNIFCVAYGDEVVEIVVEDASEPYEGAAKFGNSQYWLKETKDANSLINKKGEVLFSVEADTEIVASKCDKIFYTKNEKGIIIYNINNFQEYDGITYRACADGGVFFYGEENILFNKDGKSCKVTGIESVA